MSREKTLVKNTVIYLIGNFASRVLGFLLLPLYTHYLATNDYGYYDLVITTIAIVMPIITLQINDSMYRYLLDAKTDEESRKTISNSFFVTIAGIAVFSILFLIVAQIKAFPHAYLILIYTITTVLSGLYQQVSRGLKKNVDYALSGVIFTVATLISNIILIVFLHMKVDALMYSNIFAAVSVVLFIESRVAVYKYISWQQNSKDLIKQLVKYSAPLLPNAINWWIMSTCSRYIITYFAGMGANGIFAVSNKFPSLLMMINSVFYLAWQESAINEYNSEDKDEFYTKMFNVYMKLQLSTLLVLLPVTKWVMSFMVDKQFAEAWKYVPFLYIGAVFSSFSNFYGTGYLSSKDTKGAFTTSIAGAAANIACNLLLVPLIGIQAAALANMLAFGVMWGLRIIQTRKYFIIRIEMKGFISLTILTTLFTCLYYFNNIIVDITLTGASIILFLIYNRMLAQRFLMLFGSKLAALRR